MGVRHPSKNDFAELDEPVRDEDLQASSEIRARMPTITDEDALEEARLASIPTVPPAPRASVADAVAAVRARMAPLDRIPELIVRLADLASVDADPSTAYVLGFVDGLLPLETIVEVTGLPERVTLEVLERMLAARVIRLKPAA